MSARKTLLERIDHEIAEVQHKLDICKRGGAREQVIAYHNALYHMRKVRQAVSA